jgi:hypothetical protein
MAQLLESFLANDKASSAPAPLQQPSKKEEEKSFASLNQSKNDKVEPFVQSFVEPDKKKQNNNVS